MKRAMGLRGTATDVQVLDEEIPTEGKKTGAHKVEIKPAENPALLSGLEQQPKMV
jgi:hypothetical protein